MHTRWKKGVSGNPGGRPKGESITARLRRVLEGEHNGKVLMDLLAERIAKEALSGKHAFIKEVLDRLDGPVNQKHEVDLGPRTLAEMAAAVSDDDLVALAIKHRRPDLLPVHLRERAGE